MDRKATPKSAWEDERIKRNPASAKAPAGECVILRCGRFGLAPLGHAQVRLAASFLAASARPLPRRRRAVVRWERGCGGSRRIFPRCSIHLPSQQQQRPESSSAAAAGTGKGLLLAVARAVRGSPRPLFRARESAVRFLPRKRVKIVSFFTGFRRVRRLRQTLPGSFVLPLKKRS